MLLEEGAHPTGMVASTLKSGRRSSQEKIGKNDTLLACQNWVQERALEDAGASASMNAVRAHLGLAHLGPQGRLEELPLHLAALPVALL